MLILFLCFNYSNQFKKKYFHNIFNVFKAFFIQNDLSAASWTIIYFLMNKFVEIFYFLWREPRNQTA